MDPNEALRRLRALVRSSNSDDILQTQATMSKERAM
jgi:hypothetical protein